MAKNKLTKFICWFGGIQKIKCAKDLSDLFDKRMNKKEKSIWNSVKYIDTDEKLISIDVDSINAGWSFQQCIEDSHIHLNELDKEYFESDLELLEKIRKY